MTPDQINIHRLIIHKVDHKIYPEAVLSEMESPKPTDVKSFLKHHILLNREHRHTRNGVFIDKADDNPGFKKLCDELLKPYGQFVAKSQDIARHLFTAIDNDQRVSPGDLVIFTFSEGDNGEHWLALLKMDPQSSFVSVEEMVDGKKRIILRQVSNVLPTGELQKCAFILPESMRTDDRHLQVLDQQSSRYEAMRPIASFFSKKFLECRIGLLDSEKTRIFLLGSADWLEGRLATWPAQDVDRFNQHAMMAVQAEVTDVVHFAHLVIRDKNERVDYIQTMSGKLSGELYFNPDGGVQEAAEYFHIEGDNDLRIRIRSDAVGPNKTLNHSYNSATGVHTITIKTAIYNTSTKRGIR